MKWGNKWRNGEMRTITKFVWLPIRIDRWEGAEWVWFETVKIEQCYHTNERISSSVGKTSRSGYSVATGSTRGSCRRLRTRLGTTS